MKVFFDPWVINPLREMDRALRPDRAAGPQPSSCEVHRTAKRSRDAGFALHRFNMIPLPVTHAFLDEAGMPMCAYCVAAGILTGAVDIVNPDELLRPPDPLFPEPDGVAEARAAVPRWGLESLDVLDRAIEAARRHGRLEELRERLLDLDIRDESSQVSSTSSEGSPASPSRRFRGGKTGDRTTSGTGPLPAAVHGRRRG